MKDKPLLATAFVLLSAGSYAFLSAIVKYYGQSISLPVIIFIQSLVSLLIILPIMRRKLPDLCQMVMTNTQKKLHLYRALFGLSINVFFFLSLKYIPLVNASLLINTSPLFVPFLGLLFLRKKINHRLWLPVFLGFSGVVVVLHPSPSDFNRMSFLGLASGVSMALSVLVVRRLAEKGQVGLTVSFFYFLYASILSGLYSIPFWHHTAPIVWIAIIVSGVLWFFVQYGLSTSLMYAEPQFVSAMYYFNILFAAILGMLIWHTHPAISTWLGMLLIVLGGIATIIVQNKVNRERTVTSVDCVKR